MSRGLVALRSLTRRRISTGVGVGRVSTSSPQLRVSEMFTSVQGEGPNTGRPSVFVRLGLCNLECPWCDTKFTWLFKDEQLRRVRNAVPRSYLDKVGDKVYSKDEMQRYSVGELLERILNISSGDKIIRSIVITGGEPLLHKKALLDLCPLLVDKGYNIEVETNGTLSPDGMPDQVHYNVSAKLANSYQPESKRINIPVLKEFARKRSVLKFVVTDDSDVLEAKALAEKAGFPSERVFLMPEGTTAADIKSRGQWVVDACLALGFNYSHRVHISLWGDLRGV
uniref:Radical SAM core domain-containing protein n=1 Tax=Rhodosorus marinus TaxID=101924 RepID=A0A7S2ZJM1_9RHOD|mmetsp:Transcript_21790/g.88740  ORF Transcript_21790/g.88740 Transcript_21790/m.88740 type:complete len:282 (+) Transcript_21790:514-1359(+)